MIDQSVNWQGSSMITTSYLAGFFAILLSTILRSVIRKRSKELNMPSIKLIGFPSKENPDDVFTALGQVMGFLWIIIGVVLSSIKEKLPSGFLGLTIEYVLVFSPFFVRILLLWLLTKVNIRK